MFGQLDIETLLKL